MDTETRLPIFVYGTLRHGQPNYRLLAGRTAHEHEALLPGHQLYVARLPYVAETPDTDTVVVGELMTPRPDRYAETLRHVDRLEGYEPAEPDRGLYLRVARTVFYRTTPYEPWQQHQAWVYHGGHHFTYDETLRDPSGDWLTCRAV